MLDKNHFLKIVLLSLLVALIVAACTISTPTPGPSPLKSPPSTPVTPASPTAVPTPKSGTGAVIGRMVASSTDGPAYQGGDLYLATLIQANQPNAQPVIAFSEGQNPKATIDSVDGTFVFTDIAPGEYALVVSNPYNSFVVEEPGGGSRKVTVQINQITDLGTIVIP